jgi:hypothetical protein
MHLHRECAGRILEDPMGVNEVEWAREREFSASPYKPSPGEKADARPQTILWTMGMNIIRSTVINEDLLRDVERFNESMGCLTTLLNSLTM